MPAQGGALAKLFEPAIAWMAGKYQAAVGTELRKYGLRYEDLLDPQLNLVDLDTISIVFMWPKHLQAYPPKGSENRLERV